MSAARQAATLDRRRAMRVLLDQRGDALLVTGLGSTTYDAAAAGDDERTFYLWGGMGGAAAMGLGLAIAQRARRVLVITGDGEMLMGLGSLATVAVQAPPNLALVVFDNERYLETGAQATHTHHGVDLAAMAASAGFPLAYEVRTLSRLRAARQDIYDAKGPVFVNVKIKPNKPPLVLPPRDGAYLKSRFRNRLLGEP